MLTIRLQRRGRKNDPSFRMILVESKKKPKTGNYLELLGSYDPRQDRIDLKAERIQHWIAQGATVSDTVHNILITKKAIEGKKINVLPKKSAPVKEAPAEEVKAAPVAAAEVVAEAAPEAEVAEVAPAVEEVAPVATEEEVTPAVEAEEVATPAEEEAPAA